MILDKDPSFDLCTLEPNLTWKIWKGTSFTVNPVIFEGTIDEIIETVSSLRDIAPFTPHYRSGVNDCGTSCYLSLKTVKDEFISVQLHLWVSKHDMVRGPLPPLKEHLRNAIISESELFRLGTSSEIALAY